MLGTVPAGQAQLRPRWRPNSGRVMRAPSQQRFLPIPSLLLFHAIA